MTVFSDNLFSDEVPADSPVSDGEELTVSVLPVFAEEGAPLGPPVTDGFVRIDNHVLALMNRRMGKASVCLSEISAPRIHGYAIDAGKSLGDTGWLCLLYSTSSRSARDGKGLDHWKGVVWDPGIVGQQYLHVCCDCLCLITLFHEIRLLAHDWVLCSLWTGAVSGYCQTITWELGYAHSINPPCDVDRLYNGNEWQIKALEMVVIPEGVLRCARVRGTLLGVLSMGMIAIMVIGLCAGGGGPVGCSDWLSVRGAAVVCPGGVRIAYIRRARSERSSLHAAPVTGSLVFSIPLSCLAVCCAAGLSSWLLFGGTDCAWRAGCKLNFRHIKVDFNRQIPLGLRTAVAVPGVLVYGVEWHTTGLYGPSSWGARCSLGC